MVRTLAQAITRFIRMNGSLGKRDVLPAISPRKRTRSTRHRDNTFRCMRLGDKVSQDTIVMRLSLLCARAGAYSRSKEGRRNIGSDFKEISYETITAFDPGFRAFLHCPNRWPGDVEHYRAVSCRDLDIPGPCKRLPGGDFAPFGFGTFTADGSYIGTTTDPRQSTHHGVWLRVGNRKFVLSTMFFTRNETGVHTGISRTRIAITMAEDMKSYDATVERILMDTAGKELQVITGIRGHSVRMPLETQRNPLDPEPPFRPAPAR